MNVSFVACLIDQQKWVELAGPCSSIVQITQEFCRIQEASDRHRMQMFLDNGFPEQIVIYIPTPLGADEVSG